MSEHRPPVVASVAADYIGSTEGHVRTLTRRGEIPHLRIGRKVRYRLDDLDRWLDDHARGVA